MVNVGGGGTLGRRLVVNWFHHIFFFIKTLHETWTLLFRAARVASNCTVSISPFLIMSYYLSFSSWHDSSNSLMWLLLTNEILWILFQNVWGWKLWTCSLVFFFILSHIIVCYASWIGKFLQWQFKRTLSRHFCSFPGRNWEIFLSHFFSSRTHCLKIYKFA